MLIQVDVDSTLYDANRLFYEVGTREFGIEWPETYYFWFKAEDIGTDLDTLLNVFKRCHSAEHVGLQVPYEGALDTLRSIVEEVPGTEIAYISDRDESLQEPLYNWLNEHGFLFSPDTHVDATKDKREWMRENKPDIVIDDRIRTMMLARFELDAQVLAIQHGHNMNLRGEAEDYGIHVVKDWTEGREVLWKKIIPQALVLEYMEKPIDELYEILGREVSKYPEKYPEEIEWLTKS